MQISEENHPLLAELNSAQKEAVTSPAEHRLILAGAGSGKTRVLVHRIAWLIAVEDCSPMSVLAVTFTNKAASEMRGRIEQLITVPMRSMWVGTFHGLAHRMLRLHWKEAGLDQNFQILDSDDQLRLTKRVLKALDLSDEQWPPRTVTAWINAQKEEARRPSDFDDQGDFTQGQFVRIYAAYEQACANGHLVDFAELLLRAYELTRDCSEIQKHYRRRFRHILVDEFQDTNTLQYRWLKVLAGPSAVMFAVGDDDQSIYSWRGARVENMSSMQTDFAGTEVIRLEQNYRSTGTILKAANGLIEKNSNRLGKNLWTDTGEGEPIALYAAYNEYDEAEFVANRVREHLDGPCRHSDIAVLYRANAQSRVLEEMLIKARVPYRIYGGLRFFERQEVKDALAYLRLLQNRDDDGSFERAVNTPARGIGATTLEKVRNISRASGVSMWKAARNAGDQLGRSAAKVSFFLKLIDDLQVETELLPLSDAMEKVILRSGLREHYQKSASAASRGGRGSAELAEGRLENLDELVSAARSFEADPSPADLNEDGEEEMKLDPITAFLTHATLESGEGQARAGEDCIQLMTLHAAKGLEFPVVFIVGAENGLFPSMRAVDEGNLEEERRLFYVGITRARRKLSLAYAELRRVHGTEQIGGPSMFLKEIPVECIAETRPRQSISRPGFGAREPGRAYGGGTSYLRPSVRPNRVAGAPTTGPGGFSLGQSVVHPKFGEGTIISFDGDGDRAQVEINFREAGLKRLVIGFAKLRAA